MAETNENYIHKTRLAALTMAVELAKLEKNPNMNVTAKAKELYDYIDKGIIFMRQQGETGK